MATGPGLAIRIICGDEPYQGSDFAETNIILGQIVDFVTAVKKVSYMDEVYLFLAKKVYEVLTWVVECHWENLNCKRSLPRYQRTT